MIFGTLTLSIWIPAFAGTTARNFSKLKGFDLGRFSVGAFAGNKDLLLDEDGEGDEAGLSASWERTMPEVSDRLWLCLEYVGTNSSYGTVNFGFAWKFADNVGVLFGYDIPNNEELPATTTIQVDIDF